MSEREPSPYVVESPEQAWRAGLALGMAMKYDLPLEAEYDAAGNYARSLRLRLDEPDRYADGRWVREPRTIRLIVE